MSDWRSTTDWERIADSLLGWIIWRYGRDFPLGSKAEDIAQIVIEKAWSGKRKYDPEKGELLPWLKSQARSEITNLARKAASRSQVVYDFSGASDTLNEPQDVQPEVDPYHDVVLDQLNLRSTEVAVEVAEQEERHRDFVSDFSSLYEDDPDLKAIVEVLLSGKTEPTPQAIAEALGRRAEDLYQPLQKLRRRFKSRFPDGNPIQ